jgi:type IV secretion system protein VirB4
MMLFMKKKDAVQEAPAPANSVAASTAAFVPYYCHFNDHTLLTKNGELMQIIKINSNLNGLDYESSASVDTIVREKIRQAVTENVMTDKVSFWFHTVRKRRPIKPKGTFRETFAGAVHERWQQLNRWKYQYYNEIYISILYEGQDSPLLDGKNLRHVLLPKSNRDFRNAYLDVVYEELNNTVNAIIQTIRGSFNAQRLSVIERMPEAAPGVPVAGHTVFYSDMMEFLGLLLNLRTEAFPLPQLDVSEALFTTIPTFGFNALETKNEAGRRRFAALLTLKQYREISPETADQLLQAPMEFVVSQSFHFIPHTGALKQYKEQKEMFDISGDDYCAHASGIDDMIASHHEQPTDFGEHQTSIMVLADEFKQLDGELAKVQKAFSQLGLITIREDIKLEECFWAQFPGNFEFIRRRDTINTVRIGGFCRLNRFPNGTATGNHWGDAVTILPTQVGSPYFFNFHFQDNGHTALFDFNSFSDHTGPVLLNFLLTEARKFDGRLFIFDRNRSADLYFQKLGGQYHSANIAGFYKDMPKDRPQMHLNPFSLEDSPRNRAFLLAWCLSLFEAPLADSARETLKAAIAQVYEGESAQRHLQTLAEAVGSLDAQLSRGFDKWYGEGTLAGIVDAKEDTLNLAYALHAFDMDPVVAQAECIIPVFSYLLHRMVGEIDGRPTMIVLHEAWDLLENPFIAPRLESLLEMLQENNAMVIFATGKPAEAMEKHTFATVMKACATRIFLPDDIGRDYTLPALELEESDGRMMLRMDRQRGDFLIKQHGETIALRADIHELDDMHAVFANDIKNLSSVMGRYNDTAPEAD